MQVKDAVRSIMEQKGIGPNALARMIGKIPQTVCDRLNKDKGTNLSIDKLDELISVMGYKIALIPKEADIADGWYEVTTRQEDGTPVSEA